MDLCFCANSVLSWLPSKLQGQSWPLPGDSPAPVGSCPLCKEMQDSLPQLIYTIDRHYQFSAQQLSGSAAFTKFLNY